MKLGFVITNDKAPYVAKEDSICLFSVAREAALNEQQIKPCVPLPISAVAKQEQNVVSLIKVFFNQAPCSIVAINRCTRIALKMGQK